MWYNLCVKKKEIKVLITKLLVQKVRMQKTLFYFEKYIFTKRFVQFYQVLLYIFIKSVQFLIEEVYKKIHYKISKKTPKTPPKEHF